MGSGLVSLAGAHACGILAYHKGYSGFCLGRNGRCHTQFTFFEMLLGIGGTRVQGTAGGPRWNLPHAEGCGLRGGAMTGSDGSMFCYQLNSNPCLSDLDFYWKRSSQHSQLPCSVHASCTFSIGRSVLCCFGIGCKYDMEGSTSHFLLVLMAAMRNVVVTTGMRAMARCVGRSATSGNAVGMIPYGKTARASNM